MSWWSDTAAEHYARVRRGAAYLIDGAKASWEEARKDALERFGALAERDPTGSAAKVRDFLAYLTRSKTALGEAKAAIRHLPPARRAAFEDRLNRLQTNHEALAAGIFEGAKPATAEVGAAPLVIGGVVVGIAAVAWAWSNIAAAESQARMAEAESGRAYAAVCKHFADLGQTPPAGMCRQHGEGSSKSSGGAFDVTGAAKALGGMLVLAVGAGLAVPLVSTLTRR